MNGSFGPMDILSLLTFGLLVLLLVAPPLVLVALYWVDRRQTQHAVLRNFPILDSGSIALPIAPRGTADPPAIP